MDIIRRLRLLGQSASLGKASCKSIGEEAAAEIERLTAENERLRAALDSLLGDKAMSEALWGKLPDDATMTITIKLGAYRKAQSVRHTFQQTTVKES